MSTRKLTLADMAERFGKQLTCLRFDHDYTNSFSTVNWRCHQGHEFEASVNSLRAFDIYCPTCRKIERTVKRKQALNRLLNECHDYAHIRGGLCLTTELSSKQSIVRWQCAHGHVWEMAFGYMQSEKAKSNWCPVCSRDFDGYEESRGKFSMFQRIVLTKAACQLRDLGFTMKLVSEALNITLYDLEYCYSKFQNTEPETCLQPDELLVLEEKINSVFEDAISHLAEISGPSDTELHDKLAASLAAKEITENRIPLAYVAEAFGIERSKLYYWIKTLLPKYSGSGMVSEQAVVDNKAKYIQRAAHLGFNKGDPLSDIDKLKRSVDFKVVIVCILKDHRDKGTAMKRQISTAFNLQWSTLSRWEKTISHRMRIGEITNDVKYTELQRTVESFLEKKLAEASKWTAKMR